MSTKSLQTGITIVLALVLAALVAGYVYFGMQQAKNDAAPLAVEEQSIPSSEDSLQLSAEEKQAIIQNLSLKASDTVTPAEREVILNSLSTDQASNTVSNEERETILKNLQK